MDFLEFLMALSDSEPEDWHVTHSGDAETGPAYRWQYAVPEDTGRTQLECVESHIYTAVLKPDLSIRLAWGLLQQREYQADWLSKAFDDSTASRHWVDTFYNAGLVFRTSYLLVDGARAILPFIDTPPPTTVPDGYANLIRLISYLSGKRDWDRYMATAEIVNTSGAWP